MTQLKAKSAARTKAEPRVQTIANSLREIARAGGPHSKLPRVRDLCEQLGTSINTLDDALGKLESQRIIYRQHGLGIYVSPRIHHKSVLIFLGARYFDNPNESAFYGRLTTLLLKEAERLSAGDIDFSVHFVKSIDYAGPMSLDGEIKRQIESGNIDGIIGIGLEDAHAQWLLDQNVALVGFACGAKVNVGMDWRQFFRLASEALKERGARNIAILMASKDPMAPTWPDVIGPEEYPIFQNNFASLSWIYPGDSRLPVHESGYSMARDLFSRPRQEWPDGILVGLDLLTFGVVKALHELGIRPGRDIHIATHANAGSILLYDSQDNLILVEVDPTDFVAHLFSALTMVMNGESTEQKLLMCEFHLRYGQDVISYG